jgi:hypothetical protein
MKAAASALLLLLASSARAQAGGFERAVQLEHAAFHTPGVPSAIVHAPPGFDRRAPLSLVVFLHGFSCCVPALMSREPAPCRAGDVLHEGWDLGGIHDSAHTNTLLIVPQLALMKRDGNPGAFARAGGFRAFLEELLAGPLAAELGGPRTLRDVSSIDLVAHSGGYHALLAVLEHGGLPSRVLHGVVMLDALYGETPRFAAFVAQHASEGLHFVSIALPNGTTAKENRELARLLRARLGASAVTIASASGLADAVAAHAIVIAEGSPPHRLMPATHLPAVLRALHGRSRDRSQNAGD